MDTTKACRITQHELAKQYEAVRRYSLFLTEHLSAEDQNVQSMPDASPIKWHLAHTTWFFETLVLKPFLKSFEPFNPRYHYLFNSYYESLGERHPRPQRGLLTRPTIEDIRNYREQIDIAMKELLATCSSALLAKLEPLITLGIHHEQQHQELMVTDIVHAFSCNPLLPAYRATIKPPSQPNKPSNIHWLEIPKGIKQIGHKGDSFAFDNEKPTHDVLLSSFEIAHRLVTCGEYLEFIMDGGYQRAEFWLSEGWAAVQSQQWRAPLYWLPPGDWRAPAQAWQVYGLDGVHVLEPDQPVMNLSFYEAAAFAEWSGVRLPTEFEWEAASQHHDITQLTSHAWQWTRSSYDPYPGFKPLDGVASEYNGKFMVGQLVLRGGSFATPEGHTRVTYRNFFPPAARWQFSGIRLARDR